MLTYFTLLDSHNVINKVHDNTKLKEVIEKINKGENEVAGFDYKQGVLFYKGRLVISENSAWNPKLLEEYHSTPQG